MDTISMNGTGLAPAFLAGAFDQVAGISTIPMVTPISVFQPTSPWQLLDKAWMAIFGIHAEEFRFTPGKTPLATFHETTAMLVVYYTTILAGREWMRNRPAYKLNTLFLIHNFSLTAISGGLLVLFLEQLLPRLWSHGLYDGICGAGGWTDKLVVLYYLNYLTKYLEFIDTCFLFLKKKPLTFLHTYHHGATAALCFSQLLGRTSVSWVPITLNLFVHVVMYWYYFQAARGIKIWWKEWITRLQIIQFVLDLGFVYFACYSYYTSAYFPNLPHFGSCAGEEFAAFMGCGILSSYLVLFVSFYIATYNKGKAASKAATKSMSKMNKTELPNATESSEKASEVFGTAKDLYSSVDRQRVTGCQSKASLMKRRRQHHE